MGDRSSFILITSRQALPDCDGADLVTGLSMYSHWGGTVAILDALTTCRDVGLNRVDDPAYFTRILARAFTRGDDGELGSGLSPFSFVMGSGKPLLDAKLEIHSEIYSHEQPYVPIIDLTDCTSTRWPTLYVLPSDFTYRDISKREVAYPLDKENLTKVIKRLSVMG